MTWIDHPEVRLSTQEGRLTAETRGGDVLRYEAYELEREPGVKETLCPTVEHIIAAAGW